MLLNTHLDISGHVYVHYATLNIYMLLNTYVDMNMSIMQLWEFICYLTHMWTCVCPLCNFEHIYVTEHISGHVYVHCRFIPCSINMLSEGTLTWICYLTHIWTYICPWSHITPLTWLQTCCQSTLQRCSNPQHSVLVLNYATDVAIVDHETADSDRGLAVWMHV